MNVHLHGTSSLKCRRRYSVCRDAEWARVCGVDNCWKSLPTPPTSNSAVSSFQSTTTHTRRDEGEPIRLGEPARS
ncbi:hypothetical protein JAAARDRAFT_42180 [Jaapia argillacea MUCL 33604]|uniref:Uncharacterized protein n=1 Tax=Jaapia argillacea MUCL 33604 TaxID=933084 RepID=A0A067PIJ8_9AGAM|nr:hypothetical protein JAAARDRAFT_42180 [Jaapia argillacea MUCL 33604]